jgi:DHA1 family bicyclomycin/chloramphenicol resistance-like MFS transporter
MSKRPPLSRARAARFILILGSLTAFAPLSIDMYLPAFPALQAHFGVSAGQIQATLAVFFVGLAAGQAIYGPIADRFGRRAPLLFGIALYVAASILAAHAPDIGSLTLARLFQALGGCAGMVISRAMVADLFDERDSAKIYSLLMLVMGMAPILAPLAGAYLLVAFGWGAIFWFLAAFGALCLATVWTVLPETLPPDRRATGGLHHVLRVYKQLLRNRRFLAFAAIGAFSLAGLFAYITDSSFIFIELYGLTPEQYGMLFGMNALGLITAAQVNVHLLRWFSVRQILATAVLAYVGAAVALTFVATTDLGGLIALMIPLFVAISSLGLVLGNAAAAAMAQAGDYRGTASALIGVLQFALSAAISGLAGALQNGTAVPMATIILGCGVTALIANRLAGARTTGGMS